MVITRSENMRRIRSKDTKSEIIVRKMLRTMGYTGYRLHRGDLPGKPDIVFLKRKKAIFVHGCFWHGHDCKEGLRKPKTNLEYWIPKIEKNKFRDKSSSEMLKNSGWDVLIIWDCELSNIALIRNMLMQFLK